ncbi:MAG: DUF3107 domain-containing protein [Ruaniaceae bacterium]|nr:DUF3107 domain-containing protein [Ruaniaceae bacterium]
MDVTIGTLHSAREITITVDLTEAELKKTVEKAIIGTHLELVDVKGQVLYVPTPALAYVMVGSTPPAPVGFRI